jgi:hypothetical protein
MPSEPPPKPDTIPGSPGVPAEGQDERREFRRAVLDKQVLIDDDRVPQPLRARNVSGGGIAVDASVVLEVGSVVEVYFELPIGVAIEARAEVVRVDGGTMALRFLELAHDQEVALRSYCRLSGLHRLEVPIRHEE